MYFVFSTVILLFIVERSLFVSLDKRRNESIIYDIPLYPISEVPMTENKKFDVRGMSCASCVSHVEKAVKKLDGVKDVSVSLLTNSMLVSFDESIKEKDIIQAVKSAGYSAHVASEKENTQDSLSDEEEMKNMKKRLFSSLVLLVPLFYIGMGYMLNMEYETTIFPLGAFGENEFFVALTEMTLSLIIMIINRKFFISGTKSILHRQPNMDALVALGSGISFLYSFIMLFIMSFYAKNNEWDNVMKASMNLSFETAGMVPTLITIGKTLETYSKGKTTSAIKGLLNLQPKQARVLQDGKEEMILAKDVKKGDILLILPGESFPVDGIILEGNTSVDESCLTGESLPIDKTKGDRVSSGTNNINGSIKVEATEVGEETTLSKIVKMVENASSTKTKISTLADKVAGFFVPIVLCIAALVFLFWMLFGSDFVSSLNDSTTLLTYSISKAISVLVISCPCALGLATPVAIMVASGKGAKCGILYKTASALEETGKVDFVLLDKTGTITKGKPSLMETKTYSFDENELLRIASSLEMNSEHPLSLAIKEEAKNRKISSYDVTSFKALIGYGVEGMINNKKYCIGNDRLMEERKFLSEEARKDAQSYAMNGQTPVFLADEKRILGILSLADPIKEDSSLAIEEFKKMGITPIMLTGDNQKTAHAIAKQAGIDFVISDLLPDGKQSVIKELQSYGKVLMIGDGINDAPSLTQADIGMAIGAGSDIAIDSADVVLTKSTLMDAIRAIQLSRETLRNIKENLFWAFIYNLIMIPIAAGCFSAIGLAKLRPWMGALSMALSSLCVVLNALRLNLYSFKDILPHRKKKKELPSGFFKKKSSDEKAKTLFIKGMMCENCVSHVKKVLEEQKEITSADVSLKENKAIIYLNADIDDGVLKKLIHDEGYQVTKIINE